MTLFELKFVLFLYFITVSPSEFNDPGTVTIVDTATDLDLVFVLDGTAEDYDTLEAIAFLADVYDRLSHSDSEILRREEGPRFALVSFTNISTGYSNLSKGQNAFQTARDSLFKAIPVPQIETEDNLRNIYAGIQNAVEILKEQSSAKRRQIIMMVTTGDVKPKNQFNNQWWTPMKFPGSNIKLAVLASGKAHDVENVFKFNSNFYKYVESFGHCTLPHCIALSSDDVLRQYFVSAFKAPLTLNVCHKHWTIFKECAQALRHESPYECEEIHQKVVVQKPDIRLKNQTCDAEPDTFVNCSCPEKLHTSSIAIYVKNQSPTSVATAKIITSGQERTSSVAEITIEVASSNTTLATFTSQSEITPSAAIPNAEKIIISVTAITVALILFIVILIFIIRRRRKGAFIATEKSIPTKINKQTNMVTSVSHSFANRSSVAISKVAE